MSPGSRLRWELLLVALFWHLPSLRADEPLFPPGFFVEDLKSDPPLPAFYNLQTHQLQPFPLKNSYSQFIDFFWDRDKGRVFFSAQRGPKDPFRIYRKDWPAGDEITIYENPLGPFRFLVSPDERRFALQVMGPAAWPILVVYDAETQKGTLLGQGYSPDWSSDGQRLLFLHIPGSLPSWLSEYRVDTDTATQIYNEPVMEAVYTDESEQIILKTAPQSKRCDVFNVWDRRKNEMRPFASPEASRKRCVLQRELGAFPGHQFFYFKESSATLGSDDQRLIVADLWGGRLQELERSDWDPMAAAVDPTTLLVGQDPLYLLRADGTGGRTEIPHVEMIHPHQMVSKEK